MLTFIASGIMRWLVRPVVRLGRTARLSALGHKPHWRRIGLSGLFMIIDPDDYSDRAFCLGLYERQTVYLIEKIMRPGDICIDVGAQKGYITLRLARAVRATGRVISFEPDPRAMELLKLHCTRNRFYNVTLYSCALADLPGRCTFTLSRQLGWSSRFPNPQAISAQDSCIETETRCLDDVIADLGFLAPAQNISFIKIDAEGSESLILAGAQRMLSTFRPILLFEVNKPSLLAANVSLENMEQSLHRLGYSMYRIDFERIGFRLKLSLVPVPSLISSIGEFENILAVTSDVDQLRRVDAAAPGFLSKHLAGRDATAAPVSADTVLHSIH